MSVEPKTEPIPEPQILPLILTAAGVGRLLGFCSVTIRHWHEHGRLPAPIPNTALPGQRTCLLWSRPVMEFWLQQNCPNPQTQKWQRALARFQRTGR